MKKRVFCVLLACLMLVTMLPLAAMAKTQYPVIVIGGYSSPQLYLFDDEGNVVEKIWMLNLDRVLDTVKKDIPDINKANFNTIIKRDPTYAGQQISDAVAEIAKLMRRNPDGSLPYNTGAWPRSAAESNMKYINANRADNPFLDTAVREKRLTPELCKNYGEENIYSFSVDWRQNIIECARDLGIYIQDVLQHSGAKKVNIFCESHGAEDTATYISLSSIVEKGGADAKKLGELLEMSDAELKKTFSLSYLNNVVLDNPAIGVRIMYDILMGEVHFDSTRLIDYLQYANNPLQTVNGGAEYVWESNYEWFFNGVKLDTLNFLFNRLIQNYDIINILYSFGSVWDFVPLALYDEVKAAKLTPEMQEVYAPIIAKSDYCHYTVMTNMHENLTYARTKGVNVNIITGTDITSVTGARVSGDGLVSVEDASGAKVSGYGYRFSDGYHTDYRDAGITCTNPKHDHVSPRMNLDAAYAYLPENTWFIDEQYHAQYIEDDYCYSLLLYMLFADEMIDIYSDPRFPQFEITYNGKYGVHAAFDKCVFGTITKDDTALVVKNLSNKSKIELVSIAVEGMDVSFENVYGTKIKLGGSVTLKMNGEIPDADMKNVKISIYYLENNSLFTMDSRTIHFTIRGGKENNYDPAKPLTAVKERPVFLTVADMVEGLSHFDFRSIMKAMLIPHIVFFRYIFNLISSPFKK